MTTDAADFDDSQQYPSFAEMTVRRRNDMLTAYAWQLFLASTPNWGGEPTLSPERAITLASEFVAEAMRRGL